MKNFIKFSAVMTKIKLHSCISSRRKGTINVTNPNKTKSRMKTPVLYTFKC